MAKKQQAGTGDDVLLNIGVTGRENLQDARDDAKDLNKELNKGGNVDLAAPAKSLKAQLLEAKLEAQRLFAAGQQNTQEYANAAKKVQSLKNDIDELNNTFKAFDPDNKFRVFSNAAAAGAKAIQGYAGAMAFLGVNSEDATQTLAKLQGIMAFADAIDSLNDLKDSYNDLLRMLGLVKTATTAVATEQTVLAAETEANNIAEVASEERVAAIKLQIAEAELAAGESLAVMNSRNLASIEEYFAAETAHLDALAARTALTAELATVEGALVAEQNAQVLALEETAVATAGVTVAEEGATAASFTLGAALKAIGIGLLISAIAYLVTNFKEIKKAVIDLFPGLGEAGNLFNKFKEIAFGVGGAIIDFIVAPIKAIIKLVQGDFKAALGELAKGADFVGNYQKGAAKEVAAQAEEARKERVKKEIEANERIIKERKALGENTLALEVANKRRAISILDKEDEDYLKDRADLETEITVLQNSEYKRQADAYKAKLKEDLDKIRENALAAQKIVRDGSKTERTIALSDIDIKYKAELDLLNKRKAANANYNKDYAALVNARKIEEQKINKKYDDAIVAYQKDASDLYLSEFEKKEAEINKKAEELLKTAVTAPEKANIISTQSFLNARNKAQETASQNASKAGTNLTNVENSNRPSENDTPEEAAAKVKAVADARRAAEIAAFDAKKAELEGQYLQLEDLEATHNKTLTDINKDEADARKEIAKLETENRLKLFDAVAAGAGTASELIGESTLAGKALAVASATISTYSAIAGQLAAFSGIPIPGYAIAQAIATGLVGLANVKKILTVKVPAKGGDSSAGGGATLAPVINSTVLTRNSSGSNDISQAIKDKEKNQKPIKAYITNKDLETQAEKANYYNTQSTY